MVSIFLSHSHNDKPFVDRLADDLRKSGYYVWTDSEIKVGDYLIKKIREGIDNVDYVGAVISSNSVESEWVNRELEIAMNQEIEEKKVKVLPLRLNDIDMPGFLKGKKYADFSSEELYCSSLQKIKKILAEFNQNQKFAAREFVIRGYEICPDAPLQHASLKQAALQQANLKQANLRNANLEQANLWNANLEDANLMESNLNQAKLKDARLARANIYKANLMGANLQKAVLKEVNLQEANLMGADLKGANLIGADLKKANLAGSNFENVALDEKCLNTIFESLNWDEAYFNEKIKNELKNRKNKNSI